MIITKGYGEKNMATVKRNIVPIRTQKEMENMSATIEMQAGLIDYLAMMSDIDIPSEDDNYEQEV